MSYLIYFKINTVYFLYYYIVITNFDLIFISKGIIIFWFNYLFKDNIL
jgi:hypothetical protein